MVRPLLRLLQPTRSTCCRLFWLAHRCASWPLSSIIDQYLLLQQLCSWLRIGRRRGWRRSWPRSPGAALEESDGIQRMQQTAESMKSVDQKERGGGRELFSRMFGRCICTAPLPLDLPQTRICPQSSSLAHFSGPAGLHLTSHHAHLLADGAARPAASDTPFRPPCPPQASRAPKPPFSAVAPRRPSARHSAAARREAEPLPWARACEPAVRGVAAAAAARLVRTPRCVGVAWPRER